MPRRSVIMPSSDGRIVTMEGRARVTEVVDRFSTPLYLICMPLIAALYASCCDKSGHFSGT
jgi:hypothetical protein